MYFAYFPILNPAEWMKGCHSEEVAAATEEESGSGCGVQLKYQSEIPLPRLRDRKDRL